MIKDFEKKYGVDIRLSTFNDADEALTKIASGEPRLRPLLPELRLARASWSRPTCCGRSTTTTSTNTVEPVAPASATPGTTRARATPIPYTVYSTGIGWRTDMSPTSTWRRRQPLRRLLGHRSTRATSRSSTTGTRRWRWCCCATVSTTSTPPIAEDIAMVREQLLELRDTMRPQGDDPHVHRHARRSVRPVPDVVRGRDQHARTTCRRASRADVLRYWFPAGRARRGRQRPGRLPRARATNPVAAHFFMNDLLDEKIAGQNFGFTGYQPPLTAVHPRARSSRRGTCRRTSQHGGRRAERLRHRRPAARSCPLAADAAYHQIWQEFKAGG